MTASTPDGVPDRSRPVLIFDGDCGFCRHWISRLAAITGERVQYLPSSDAAAHFSAITPEEFRASVVLVEPDGRVSRGAEAVFRTLATAPGHRGPRWIHEHVPPAKRASEAAYRWVARHRDFFSRLTHLLWGREVAPGTFAVARELFVRGLGLVYFAAFASLAVQVTGLLGHRGILPADQLLPIARVSLGPAAWTRLPSIFWWLGAGDAALRATCFLGGSLSVLLAFGILPAVLLPLLWVAYLSLVSVGSDFLSFQWDALLLEAGFIACFLAPRGLRPLRRCAPPPAILVFLVQWLLFRLMFGSGLSKILSGDMNWRGLHALDFHYQTQPLPTPLGWYAQHLPPRFQEFSTAITLAVELVVPFFIFAPRRLRHAAGGVMIVFQLLIALTGNFAFFNLLAIVLALMLFDDLSFRRRSLSRAPRAPLPRRAVAVALVALSVIRWAGSDLGWRAVPRGVRGLMAAVAPFQVVNNYGLFAVMTTTRPEIVIEGSDDGVTWKAYEFRWKPGDLRTPPRWVAPHQPRLDWQLWFAALGRYDTTPWFSAFMGTLLTGSPDVLALLAKNPFPAAPPRLIRARLYRYEFTDLGTRAREGRWWAREEAGLYSPVLSLRPRSESGGDEAPAPGRGSAP